MFSKNGSLILLILTISLFELYGQKDFSFMLLPERRLWPVIFHDPLECQIMGSSAVLFRNENDPGLYSTVNLGFSKPVFAGNAKKFSWELNFGTAVFSQFDLIKKEDGVFLAGLMNNDFKLTGDLTLRRNSNLLRLRTFHLSSHLGDDFMLRHPDTLKNDKSGNYEQADLTYMRLRGNNFFYAGGGWIYTIYAFRKRLSFQTGGIMNIRNGYPVSYFAGADVKLLAENNFEPDLRILYGVSFNRRSLPLARIWIEYYSGRLPYGTIDYGRINWLGATLAIAMN